jgi:DNA polymerase-4/DNA polymerase V
VSSASIDPRAAAPLTLHSLPKAILHIDCDAFFASVEQSMNPKLKGRPVVTGKERGIAASMSYEAKRQGVVRGMRLFEVKKVCPDCVILPNDYETYSLVSRRFFGILKEFTPDIEEFSIDEAYADISGLRRVHHGPYEEIALKIKETIETRLDITVSVGLSLTKSLAKICSKEKKPAGFTCVKGHELHHFLKTVPTDRVCGFGPNTVALLKKYGIETVWDYVERPQSFAKKILGKIGEELWHELRGKAVYKLQTDPAPAQASLSKVKTFTPPSTNKEFIKAQLLRNLESAFIKLRRHGLRTPNIGIFLRDSEFKSSGLAAELSRATASTLEAAPVAADLFEKIFNPRLRYRQTGVYFYGLEPDRELQYDLFEDPCRVKALKKLSETMDRINEAYGKHTIHIGSTTTLETYRQHLGGRGDLSARKENLLKGETFRQHLNVPLWNIAV